MDGAHDGHRESASEPGRWRGVSPSLASRVEGSECARLDGYEVSIVRWVDRTNDVLTVLFAAVGIGLDFLTWGAIGWAPTDTEPRWLIRARDPRTGRTKTVGTTFTGLGARLAARSVRRRLRGGDQAAFAALPGLAIWNGPEDE